MKSLASQKFHCSQIGNCPWEKDAGRRLCTCDLFILIRECYYLSAEMHTYTYIHTERVQVPRIPTTEVWSPHK